MNLNFSLFVTECCTEVCLQNLEDNYKWDSFYTNYLLVRTNCFICFRQ